nr:Silent information regulator protein Sir2 [uncultured bacterium]
MLLYGYVVARPNIYLFIVWPCKNYKTELKKIVCLSAFFKHFFWGGE